MRQFAAKQDFAGSDGIHTEDGAAKFRSTGTDQAGHAGDFALPELERDIAELGFGGRKVADFQDGFAGRQMFPFVNVIDLTAHHVANQLVSRDISQNAGVDHGTVAEDSEAVADLAEFVHAVRDVNDGHAAGFQVADDAEDLLGFGIGE